METQKNKMIYCIQCNKNPARKGMLTCSKECSKAYRKAYRKSDKWKAYMKAYQKSDKWKAYQKAYYQRRNKEIGK